MSSLHFKTPKHEALKCEGFSNMHNNKLDGICHAMETEHENGCKQKLKQKNDFNDVKKPKYSKPLVVGAKVFMQVAKKGDAFFIYVLPMLDVEPCQHEIPSQYHSRTC
jgi:hypothetical protein